jgi:hypothetical protein
MPRRVSKSLLPSEAHAALPASSAVYRLYFGDTCLYVGATICLRRRLYSHPLRGQFNRVEVDFCAPERLYWVEGRHIDRYKPTLNKMRNGGYCHARVMKKILASRTARRTRTLKEVA